MLLCLFLHNLCNLHFKVWKLKFISVNELLVYWVADITICKNDPKDVYKVKYNISAKVSCITCALFTLWYAPLRVNTLNGWCHYISTATPFPRPKWFWVMIKFDFINQPILIIRSAILFIICFRDTNYKKTYETPSSTRYTN